MHHPKQKVLVIGGAGYIGSHLLAALLEEGHHVRCLDIRSPSIQSPLLEWHEGSFVHEKKLREAMSGCQVIYHLASTTIPQTSNEDPLFDIDTNLIATVKLLDIAKEVKGIKIIFTSSGGTVYGIPQALPVKEDAATTPLCSYGVVKLAIEKYILLYHHLYNLDGCVLRLSNPYGGRQRHDSGQGVIAAFCHKAINNQPLEIWGDGSVIRDYIYIDDVVDALLRAMHTRTEGEILNISSGHGASLNDIMGYINHALGQSVTCHYLAARPFDVPAIYLCNEKAKRILKWEPVTALADGITELVHAHQSGRHKS